MIKRWWSRFCAGRVWFWQLSLRDRRIAFLDFCIMMALAFGAWRLAQWLMWNYDFSLAAKILEVLK